jgi:hypothetical protein
MRCFQGLFLHCWEGLLKRFDVRFVPAAAFAASFVATSQPRQQNGAADRTCNSGFHRSFPAIIPAIVPAGGEPDHNSGSARRDQVILGLYLG